MSFFDPRFDAARLFAQADVRPQRFAHPLATLAPAWDIAVDAGSLRVPIFLALGCHDYTAVSHVLWHGVAPSLPTVTRHLFERSGHQPFVEEPDRFSTAVIGWMGLKRLLRRSGRLRLRSRRAVPPPR